MFLNTISKITLTTIALLSLALSLNAAIYHVDEGNTTGIEDGLSWATAFTDLQGALTLPGLTAGDQILIAAGNYFPSTTDPDISFELVNGVEMLGGYPTGGGARNPDVHQSILNGGGFSYSVLFSEDIGGGTILDGLTITGGIASGTCGNGGIPSRQKFGGGWVNINGSPTVRNCNFEGNSSSCSGGAIYNDGGSGKVCNPIYTDCDFIGNYGGLAAGAVYNNGNGGAANSTFYNCKIISNSTNTTVTTYGAAIYNLGKNGSANSLFVNCVLAHNSGFAGGSIYSLGSDGGQANINTTNCLFFANNAALSAGALYTNAGNTPGGGTSIATIQNCIFWSNVAGQFGGDLFKNNNGEINLTECIIDKPNCTDGAAGNVPPNCITGIQYNEDPMLTDPYNDNYELLLSSAAIGQGNNGFNPLSTDLDGNTRIQQGTIDLGPLESPFAPLAVELTDFQANRNGDQVVLTWTTYTEVFHDHFEIEKSTDGIYFQSIGEQAGENFEQKKTEYSFVDVSPNAGTNYYRINSIDFAKKEQYSPVRNVVFSSGSFTVYPNPTSSFINIQTDRTITKDLNYSISNAVGQVVYKGVLNARTYNLFERIDLPVYWDTGLYFIHFDAAVLSTAEPIKFNLIRNN